MNRWEERAESGRERGGERQRKRERGRWGIYRWEEGDTKGR